MSEPLKKDLRKAWDPETMGYGKHTYRHLDPDTVNVEDFAKDMRGEQQHKGDVREENTAYNEQSLDNTISLDMLSKIGTVFETEAPEYPGRWIVAAMPVVRSPEVFCSCHALEERDGEWVEGLAIWELSCVVLGCAVDVGNKFRQVAGKVLVKGKHQNLG